METSRHCALPGLSARQYARNSLHADSAIWLEKNCYIDVSIELLHAIGLEPRAMLPFTLAVDFVGDQWTFFKPSHDELYALYGVDVQELTVWKPLLEHAREHLSAGRLISTEADAFWLPDTAGTDYRHKHTKTSIVLNDLDEGGRRLGYFHNAGYFELEGEDFDRTFRIGEPADPAFMPLYAELVLFDRAVHRPPQELRELSRQLLFKHLGRRPTSNPIERFARRFETELPELREKGIDHYHAWAFASTRQLGAAFELAAEHLAWLDSQSRPLQSAAQSLMSVASNCKVLLLKSARLMMNAKPFADAALFKTMQDDWQRAMSALEALHSGECAAPLR
jgi:hypothetical protein